MKNNNDLFYTCSLIEDVCDDDYDHVVDRLVEVYTSWIDAVLCNYNTDVYYQSRDLRVLQGRANLRLKIHTVRGKIYV